MATGLEMLITTLIKAAKLEPEIDKIRVILNDGQFLNEIKETVELVRTFDERLARIERKLGIEPDTDSDYQRREARLYSIPSPQS